MVPIVKSLFVLILVLPALLFVPIEMAHAKDTVSVNATITISVKTAKFLFVLILMPPMHVCARMEMARASEQIFALAIKGIRVFNVRFPFVILFPPMNLVFAATMGLVFVMIRVNVAMGTQARNVKLRFATK